MPSYREIMRLMGYRSLASAQWLVKSLAEAGVVAKDRAGKLIPKHPFGETKLLGVVEAGFPSAAEEELLDTISFDEYLTPNKEASYILKVKGDSMQEAGICEGDMVIVERRQTFKPGQIVVASIDDEYTMKYLRKNQRGYYLEPANAKYQPIYPKDGETLAVEAVVTAVVRKY